MNDDRRLTTAEEDTGYEQAVLSHVLQVHPVQLTMEELSREVATDPESFSAQDAVSRAVRELIKAGLLRMNGNCVLPTVAAVRANELWQVVG